MRRTLSALSALSALSLALPLAGCFRTDWVPLPHASISQDQALARCRFAVSSSPGSMLNGGVMPSGVLMEQCMRAEGYARVVSLR